MLQSAVYFTKNYTELLDKIVQKAGSMLGRRLDPVIFTRREPLGYPPAAENDERLLRSKTALKR